ncbi:1-acyl-sn-glycerol-3-phosphate acyltransferase [Aminipila luticellarii]|uniref:1-acyl-sn-glycerol-3-phosphate acyltransferase n=1 Tax=Aminipila luticellarii TaxID=2507160 RepID=A0A410PV04_9FIRM|nr:1-acyl-sn-glycerol-3-phosphate acyltransferase [Aminipila luticellarii]QAT42777.1 1-acyl-sn-glycerol-3-phosphate acyltransferase [Aminipila luticellarii]
MKRHKNAEIRYFKSYTDDFVESKRQSFELPEHYSWTHDNLPYRVISQCLYRIIALFCFPYCRLILHAKIKNRSVLKHAHHTGCFLYGNHTQPLGDVLLPVWMLARKRVYVVASPANLGIPVIGPILPLLGALPLPSSVSGLKKLYKAIRLHIRNQSCVVLYPEAHVWPWHTKIRPFPDTSFNFPVECDAPSFCITTTYQKRKYGKKPGITVYVDGPFYPDKSISKLKQKEKLHDEIFRCMEKRSLNSTYSYIRYEREAP